MCGHVHVFSAIAQVIRISVPDGFINDSSGEIKSNFCDLTCQLYSPDGFSALFLKELFLKRASASDESLVREHYALFEPANMRKMAKEIADQIENENRRIMDEPETLVKLKEKRATALKEKHGLDRRRSRRFLPICAWMHDESACRHMGSSMGLEHMRLIL